ncbi:hypothetical protein BT63DRAFT_417262 [Microthyrium microscopicum]|uniref:Uncharacterized protein n=1 Tax=Microthyrium microscopicum TaxID=703497 RepID=A0A6A6U448_9PEZI|nr:hypothetical protein BT63DRAFT_417262 [Microthyrium microscopicum]
MAGKRGCENLTTIGLQPTDELTHLRTILKGDLNSLSTNDSHGKTELPNRGNTPTGELCCARMSGHYCNSEVFSLIDKTRSSMDTQTKNDCLAYLESIDEHFPHSLLCRQCLWFHTPIDPHLTIHDYYIKDFLALFYSLNAPLNPSNFSRFDITASIKRTHHVEGWKSLATSQVSDIYDIRERVYDFFRLLMRTHTLAGLDSSAGCSDRRRLCWKGFEGNGGIGLDWINSQTLDAAIIASDPLASTTFMGTYQTPGPTTFDAKVVDGRLMLRVRREDLVPTSLPEQLPVRLAVCAHTVVILSLASHGAYQGLVDRVGGWSAKMFHLDKGYSCDWCAADWSISSALQLQSGERDEEIRVQTTVWLDFGACGAVMTDEFAAAFWLGRNLKKRVVEDVHAAYSGFGAVKEQAANYGAVKGEAELSLGITIFRDESVRRDWIPLQDLVEKT